MATQCDLRGGSNGPYAKRLIELPLDRLSQANRLLEREPQRQRASPTDCLSDRSRSATLVTSELSEIAEMDKPKEAVGKRLEPPKHPTGKGGIIWHNERGIAFQIIGARKPPTPEDEAKKGTGAVARDDAKCTPHKAGS